MEWKTVQHLDLRRVGVNSKPLQPHAAVFHPTQALVAVAIGSFIVEFDALTGSKISCIDIGAAVVRMSYSPTNSHVVIAIVEDCTIRSCDFDNEQTCVLHSPEKKMEHISLGTEVHLALTPLQPIVFFGFHRRMSVTVVGTADRGRPPTKIKTDLKKPVVNIACHTRHPLLYVAYADGLIRAYNIQTYAVHYTLQLDNTIKLIGAGAFAFHPSLEWIFVGDRRGTLLAWDVSTERPNMIGITQVGSQPITSVVWLPMLQLLVTLSKDGTLQVWKTRVAVNPSRPSVQANFFEVAAIESIDIPRILSQCGGEALHVLPRIKSLEVHPKYSLAALVFSDMRGADHIRNKTTYTREGRKQLFAVLQSARGSSASVLKEKLISLGSSGILADHQLQEQLQDNHVKGQSHLTMSDIARKAFLCSIYMEGHAKSAPISRLPLITIIDTSHPLRDMPVCQPFHLELNFFNKEHRVLHYPVRAFYIDGVNLMGYNICTGADNIYKKLYNSVPPNVGFQAKYIVHSKKKHLFLVVFEFSGSTNDVVLYWENAELHSISSKGANFKGRDAALIGVNDDQFVILDDDKSSISVNFLPDSSSRGVVKTDQIQDPDEPNDGPFKGSLQFMFDTEIDQIFSTPLESALLFACNGDQIGLARLVQDYNHSSTDGHYISTKYEGRKFIKLKNNETVIQVQWQESHKGYVAGILTTQRVIIASADLIIIAASSTKFDKGIPSFRSLLWVGPALLFSTATAVSLLGWDSKVRTILSISVPSSVLVGALNDRLLLANPTEVNPNREKGVEIKSYLVGLLEPLLLGFVTMQQMFDHKTELSEILYQITSRFDCLRITPRSLDILAGGSPVCGDLALALSQTGPQFTQVLRCTYAIKARRFSTALSVLKDEFLRSRDYPQCPTTSHLFHHFRELGYSCINYGQFDSAKETFEVVSDYESLLDLFTCHLNPSAMRSLAQKLENTGVDSEIRRYCERILRVRSSGWTQGIFANFAAENVAPKGSEWGGGNWEVKTSVGPKDIPQWEVAAEVVPYMKTDDGIIPSIICDHIGVYLGLIKGRGNVVDVREDSIVKAFIPVGSNVSDASSVRSNPNMAKGSTSDGDLMSLMGLESLGKPATGSTTEDEQSKTAEEFKASLYGVTADDSSGDEENVSKTKKIQIRIRDKPTASTVVDVDKIKEATRNLKVSDSMGPLLRTRSSSGASQDLGVLLSQPLPSPVIAATAPAPVISSSTNFFGTDMVIQPSASSQPYSVGMGGVVSGPIPEDFFQNTIPSLQVAASLPSAGNYESKISQNSTKDGDSREISSDKFTLFSNDIGLPDGGVPPQANQRVNTSVDPILGHDNASSLHTSKPTFQAEIHNGPHDQTMQMSSQSLDLSVLGGPASSETGKLPVHPTSVHPGQIPRGTTASVCFKTGVVHLEQNQLPDALSCFDEAFLALAKDQSRAGDVKAQATICAQYKIAVTLLQEIGRLQRVQGANAVSAKEEMGRLSRHLASLPLLARHRISCIRTAIKRNMEVQNYGYSKEMLDLMLSKAPPGKQEELRSLIGICVDRGMTNKSIDPLENPAQFCAATLSRLSTIGYDVCDLCAARFSALTAPGCIICGMGSIKRSDAMAARLAPSPFG